MREMQKIPDTSSIWASAPPAAQVGRTEEVAPSASAVGRTGTPTALDYAEPWLEQHILKLTP